MFKPFTQSSLQSRLFIAFLCVSTTPLALARQRQVKVDAPDLVCDAYCVPTLKGIGAKFLPLTLDNIEYLFYNYPRECFHA